MSAAQKQHIQYQEMVRRAALGEPYVPWAQDFARPLVEFMALVPRKIGEEVAYKWFVRASVLVNTEFEVFGLIENFDNLRFAGTLGYVAVPGYKSHTLIILERRD